MSVTLEQLKQKQAKLKQTLAELEAMIKAYEEQTEAEFPKMGDLVYYINPLGEVCKAYFNSEEDGEFLSIGNVFRTQGEAEFAVERLKVIAEMKRCGGVFSDKLNREEWFTLKRDEGVVVIDATATRWTIPIMWFLTKEAAQKAIDTIGQERLLKYWFCVEVKE